MEPSATIGTPDDLVAKIKYVLEVSGGFGTVVGFVHDWANPENTFRSWDLVARYVVPEINGYLDGLAAVAEVRYREPRRLRAQPRGRHGEDHGERECGRRARRHKVSPFCRIWGNLPDLPKARTPRNTQ